MTSNGAPKKWQFPENQQQMVGNETMPPRELTFLHTLNRGVSPYKKFLFFPPPPRPMLKQEELRVFATQNQLQKSTTYELTCTLKQH